MKVIFLFSLIFATGAFAAEKKAHKHEHHGAHQHGSATLNIAFDELQGRVEFRAAAEGVLGFEHEAKSEKDKKALAAAVTKFENEISKFVVFDAAAACVFKKEKIELAFEAEEKGSASKHGQHSDFVAEFAVSCKNSLKGSKLGFDFTSFGKLNDIDVTILIGDLQKSLELKKKPATVELK